MTSSIKNIVEITINKQIYKIACDEGQEDHINNLSLLINDEVEKLVSSLGQVGDARLLLMTCLIIADKLKEEPIKVVTEIAAKKTQNFSQSRKNNEYLKNLKPKKKKKNKKQTKRI